MNHRQVMQQALEALENSRPIGNDDDMAGLVRLHHATLKALRAALAEDPLQRMADNERELGLDYMQRTEEFVCSTGLCHYRKPLNAEELIEQAVLAEREECAKVCESLKPTMRSYDHRFWDACHLSAIEIRNRS